MRKSKIGYNLFVLTVFLFSALFSYGKSIVNVGERNGFSIRKVTSLCRDSHGFVYGISNQGVVRISSSDCRMYPLPQASALFLANIFAVGNDVRVLLHGGEMFKYDRIKDEFHEAGSLGKMIGEAFFEVYDVAVGGDSTLYVSSSKGILCMKNDSLVSRIGSNTVWSAVLDGKDGLYYSAEDGVYHYDFSNRQIMQIYRFDKRMVLLSSFYDRSTNSLWLGTLADGVYVVDFDAKPTKMRRLSTISVKQPVRAFASYNDSTVLVGIDGAGVYELSKDGNTVEEIYSEDIDNPKALKGNGINDILYTPDKTWIATYTGGVSYFENNPSPIEHIKHVAGSKSSLINNQVNHVIEDHKGRIWFGTNNGLSRWDRTDDSWQHFLQKNSGNDVVVLGLCEDDDHNIWVGSYGSGVYVLDGDTGAIKSHFDKSEDLACHFVFDVYKDRDGDVWVGASEGGVAVFSKEKGHFLNLDTPAINSFLQMEDGQMCGVGASGISRFDKTGNEKTVEFLNGYDVHQSVYYDGHYWLATSRQGLVKYNSNTGDAVAYTIDSGLPSNTINSLICISDGLFLVGTENGLCRFDVERSSVDVLVVGVACNLHSAVKLRDGRFLIGTSDGSILYDEEEKNNISSARLYIQDIVVGGRPLYEVSDKLQEPINDLKDVTIDYTKDLVTFEVVYLGGAPGCKVAWMLEGVDSEWSIPSPQYSMSYANIPWGDYDLSIRLYDSAGVNVLDETELTLHIDPPFWAKWWFITIVVLVVLVLALFCIYIRIKRHKEGYLEDKLRFLTQTMLDMQRTVNMMRAPVEKLKEESVAGNNPDRDYYLNMLNQQNNRLSLLFAQLFSLEEEESKQIDAFLTPSKIATLISRRKKAIDAVRQDEIKTIADEVRSQQPTIEKAKSEEFVAKAMEVVRQNIAKNDFGKEDFASAMCVSPSLLYKKIKQETGLSIVDFIKSMRMNYAMELLKTHKYTIAQISEMCGFSSSTYFGVVFKKYYGMSPTEVIDD